MTSNQDDPPNANAETQDDEDAIALAQSRWEKGVEFALARWLQAWYVDKMLTAFGSAHRQRHHSPAASGQAGAADPQGAVASMSFQALAANVNEWNLERRYIPLGGNAESALGDSIAYASRLLLIECKQTLSLSERRREAYSKEHRTAGTKADTKVPNPGGKNRYATLQALAMADPGLRSIGESCHILVGMHDFRAPAQQATPDEDAVWRDGELAFTPYWPFIIQPDGSDRGVVDPAPIAVAARLGASLPEFVAYISALFEQDDGAWGDAARLDREIILMVNTASVEAPDWKGGRMTRRQLKATLDQDPVHQANLRKAADQKKNAKKRGGKNTI